MIRIGIKGLAKFMGGSPAQQRKVLKDHKYPDPEGHAQATYYREAGDAIRAFHRYGRGVPWLAQQATDLEALSLGSMGQTKVRLGHNSRALDAYARHFGHKVFTILPVPKLGVSYSGVHINVLPDLHVEENGAEKIIRLEFLKEEPDPSLIRVTSQLLFEAQSAAGMGLSSSSVLYFDVQRGKVHKGARAGAHTLREVEAACKNIAALWDSI